MTQNIHFPKWFVDLTFIIKLCEKVKENLDDWVGYISRHLPIYVRDSSGQHDVIFKKV
jgi:hypothetical protein